MKRTLLLASLLLGCAHHAAPAPAEHPAYQHRFEHAENWAKVFDAPDRDAWQKPDEVVALMKIAPGMTVADVGAGTGYFEPHLSRAVGGAGRVLALDVEPDMVRYLGERATKENLANVTASQVSPDDPQLPAGAVDRVLIVDTWHHLGDRVAYARKLAAGLKPDGMIAVVDFTKDSPQGPPAHARIPPEEVARDLEAAGLHAHIADESLPDQYVVLATK